MVDAYEQAYSVLRKAEPHRWGSYAHRILFRHTADGAVVQPLLAFDPEDEKRIGSTESWLVQVVL